MARKLHELTNEIEFVEEEGGPERMVRSVHHDDMRELKALANQLAKLPPGQRKALPLDPEVIEQLDLLAESGLTPARRRTLMRAKKVLAHSDLDAVRAVLSGRGPAVIAAEAAVSWRDRIVAGNDDAINSFLTAYPGADRQALRTAAREARSGTPAASRAAQRLFKLLRDAVEAPPAAAEADDAAEGEIEGD